MLENATGSTSLFQIGGAQKQPTLHMQKHERMGGTTPVWSEATTAKEKTELKLGQALADPGIKGSPFQMALNSSMNGKKVADPGKPFGFGDLVDIVNPLQHIPVLSTLYRNVTGDEIRGSGRVLGGAIFGGPLGAGGSLMNVVVKDSTGKDIPDMALSSFTQRKEDHMLNNDNPHHPQARLNAAIAAYEHAQRQPISEVKF
jgi:hypothetical protein